MLAQNFNRRTNVAMEHNVRPALRRQGLGLQMLNFAPMFNSSRMLSFSTTALLLQNWLLADVLLSNDTKI